MSGLTMEQHAALEKGSEVSMAEVEKIKKKIIDMDASDFTKNSDKSKRRREPIVQAKVSRPKKSPGRSISETFLVDDAHNVFGYILREVIIPGAKSLLSDLVSTGIDRLLYGGDAGAIRRRNRGSAAPVVSYGRFYNDPATERRRTRTQPEPTPRNAIARRVRQSFEDVVLETRQDADEVLITLLEAIDVYGVVSLAEFYDLVGIPTTWVDGSHGWDNLSNASIVRVVDGWVINLPRPIRLS